MKILYDNSTLTVLDFFTVSAYTSLCHKPRRDKKKFTEAATFTLSFDLETWFRVRIRDITVTKAE